MSISQAIAADFSLRRENYLLVVLPGLNLFHGKITKGKPLRAEMTKEV